MPRRAAIASAFLFGTLALADASAFATGFFDVDGSMEANGWHLVRSEPKDVFAVAGGELSMRCSCSPYRGTLYSRPVELPENGELSFEIRVGEGSGPMNRMAILFKLGDLQLSVMGDSLMRRRASGDSEWKCVGAHRVANVKWTRVKVLWDNAAGRIKYYVGDMRIPTAAECGSIGPEPGESGVAVKIGNYGLDPNVFTHRLRGLSVAARAVSGKEAPGRRLALVFHGLGSEFFDMRKWLSGIADEDRVDFFLEFRGSQYLPENRMLLDGYPDKELILRAKLIVLADMPLSQDVLSFDVQKEMLEAVQDGARMILTDGLMSLEKCGEYSSPIARALPVSLESPWKRPSYLKSPVARYGRGSIEVARRKE